MYLFIQSMKKTIAQSFAIASFAAACFGYAPRALANSPAVIVSMEPSEIIINFETPFSSRVTDDGGVNGCTYSVDGNFSPAVSTGPSNNQVWDTSVRFTTLGSHTVKLTCSDSEGAITTREVVVNVVPNPDTTAPTLSGFTPSSGAVNTAIGFSVNYSDNVGVQSCQLQVNNNTPESIPFFGPIRSGTLTYNHAFAAVGTYNVAFICADAAGNVGRASKSVVITSAAVASDVTAPVLGVLTPGSATVGTSVTFSVGYTDEVGVVGCVYQEGDNSSVATLSSSPTNGTASFTKTFTAAGTVTAQFRCTDAAGNAGTRSKSIVVSAASTPAVDVTVPVIGNITPGSATVGVPVTFSATFSDNVGVYFCDLQQGSGQRVVMARTGSATNGAASLEQTFNAAGSYTVYIRCSDVAGNTGTASKLISVTNATVTPTPTTPSVPVGNPIVSPSAQATPGNLVKIRCPNQVVAADHPCKAVYYYGQDGRRHAFPNEKVYFTWYNDFSRVREVSDSFLASLTLGRNVTYRPGVRLVKFTTVNKVFAVSRGGILRWLTTEAVARALYGSNWNRNVDDVADTFYGNYSFGADITSATSFSPSAETSAATSVDINL